MAMVNLQPFACNGDGRLYMSEKFSSGTINPNKQTKTKSLWVSIM